MKSLFEKTLFLHIVFTSNIFPFFPLCGLSASAVNLENSQNGEQIMIYPQPVTCKLNNGMTVILENRPDSGVFALCLCAPDRCIYELPDKNGVGEMLANLMSDGCRGLSRGEFFSQLNSMGIILRTSLRKSLSEDNYFNNEQSVIRLETMNRFAEKSVNLLRDIVMEPNLTDDDIVIRRGQLITLLNEESIKPLSHARRIFYERITGGHSYSRNPLGETDALIKISRDDLSAYRDVLFNPSNLVLAVETSLAPDEVMEMVDRAFFSGIFPENDSLLSSTGILPVVGKRVAPLSGEENKSSTDPPPGAGAARLPNNTNGTAHSPVGSPGFSRFSAFSPGRFEYPQNRDTSAIMAGFPVSIPPEDEAALQVAISLLSSHLSYRLRECQGFAYSVITGMEKTRYGSFVKVSMETSPENAIRAAQSLREELSAFPNEYVVADDIKRIIGSYRGRTLMNRLSSINRAYYLTGNYTLGEPLNYYAILLKQMETLTGHHVMGVMKKHLGVGEMVEVVC